MTFTLPDNEENRLEALYSYNILDTSSEESFDSLTKIASTICETPIAAISFMDKDRQWYKSVEGFEINESSRDVAFCSHTILQDKIFVINNTLYDDRFSDNPFVVNLPKIRFYAGVPLKTHNGHNIGTLCVFDLVPRQLSQKQLDILSSLSIQVISLLELKINLEKLKDREANLNVLLENTDMSIWSVDLDYRITSFNSNYKKFLEDNFGVTPKIGKYINDVISNDRDTSLEYWNSLYQRTLEGEKFTIELDIKIKDKIVYIENSFSPIIINNKITGAAIFSKNITEKKLKDLKIIKSENKFKSAFDFSPIGMALVLPDGKWLKINESLCNIFGYSKEEMFFKKIEELSYPDHTNKEYHFKLHNQLLNNQIKKYQIEKRYYHKDGHIIWLSLNFSSIYNESYKLIYLIIQAENITERKNWEKRLLFKSNILQNVEDCIIITDLEDRIIYWNKGAISVFGYIEKEILGEKTDILYPNREAIKINTLFHNNFENIIKIDWKAKTKYGNDIWLDLKKTTLKDKDGEIIGYISVSRDITHKKEVEEELIKAKEIAEEALHIKSDFMATMSHEIRTPMNGIIATTELLLNSQMNPEQIELLEIIKKSGDSLLYIVNDILDFSKFEVKKMKLEKLPFDLRQTIDEVFLLISKFAEEKKIILNSFINDDIPKLLIGDVDRIKKLLLNLLNNGLKFSKQGQIYISVNILKKVENILTLKFLIRDNGIGMTKETISKLFQAFSQADSSTSRKYGGTGLGLAISKGLIDLMNGKIWVESTLGKGSDFYFTIDLELANYKFQENKNIEISDYNLKMVSEFATYYPFNILIAEDNFINQKLIKKILEKLGYEIDIANNGLEVIEAIKNKSYNLIFMDVQMPEMDGLEATKYIINNVIDSKQPKIIALTANAMQGDREICLNVGMVDYITKPVSIKILQDILIKWSK